MVKGVARVWALHLWPVIVLGACLWNAINPAAAQIFNPETFTLDNGLKVVVLSNHRVPIVTQTIWYRVGSADEVEGKTGLAHFLEHLMFKGTPSVPDGQFSKIISNNGGRDNAFTTADYTAYYQNVAADKLELVMKMEADRMVNLALEEESVKTERDVILEERRMRTDNVPAALLSEKMNAAMYAVHPYHHPVIGWEKDIRNLTRDDALAFYTKWYAPNNATLIVAGDVSVEQLRALAEKYYAPIPAREVPKRERAKEPKHRDAARVTFVDDRVQQPAWRRFYRAPSVAADPNHDSYALDVLAETMGGSVGRLYQSLVVSQKLAVMSGVSYDSSMLDMAKFSIYAIPAEKVTMETLEDAIQAELKKVADGEVTADEIDQAKRRLKAGVIYARDSLQAGAMIFGTVLSTGQDINDVEQWPQRISAITPDQVRIAAKRLLSDEKDSVTGILLPEKKEKTLFLPEGADPSGREGESDEALEK